MAMSRKEREKLLARWGMRLKWPPQDATSGAAPKGGKRSAEVRGTMTYDRFTRKMELHLDLDSLRDLVEGVSHE
jgi:hypothetical protein